jgi:adenine-specific DNA-methyltransferase
MSIPIDGIFTFDELRATAEAARAAGGRELHCLAWEFEMDLALNKQSVEAETGLSIRLKYIPREIMEPNRNEVQFFEAGYLEARAITAGGKVDVELVRFAPSLAEAPEKEMAALRERSISPGARASRSSITGKTSARARIARSKPAPTPAGATPKRAATKSA